MDIENSILKSHEEYPFRVRITPAIGDNNIHWHWCRDNLQVGSWKMMIRLLGASSIYCFTNAEDAVAFKLRFGL
jgi:hypothetical protein